MSRRKKLSERTANEIKDIARRLMAEKGTAGLSIRAIAREIEMTPPAIYTYFPSLDDLITALILDAFNAYADTLEAARDAAAENGASLAEQLVVVSLAYRTWAVEHPAQFKLIYGSPIPGYHAPREVTVPAVTRTGAVFMGIVFEMWARGEAPLPTSLGVPPTVTNHIERFIPPEVDPVPGAVDGVYELYSHWTHLHGMVTLEVFGHLQGTVGDVEAFYRHEVQRIYQQMGIAVSA
ncbi:MAG: TetR/AcrR family transcriptional regulator [Chloroflexota bacterium]